MAETSVFKPLETIDSLVRELIHSRMNIPNHTGLCKKMYRACTPSLILSYYEDIMKLLSGKSQHLLGECRALWAELHAFQPFVPDVWQEVDKSWNRDLWSISCFIASVYRALLAIMPSAFIHAGKRYMEVAEI